MGRKVLFIRFMNRTDADGFYLVRIALKNRLLLELEFARILAITLYMHCSMVVAVDITQNQIIDAGCDLKLHRIIEGDKKEKEKTHQVLKINKYIIHLAPLESLPIIKL